MISIDKGKEPRSLKEYKNDSSVRCYEGDVWENGPALANGLTLSMVKKDVREALYREQHGLCAYCLRSISLEESKIEHFLPRSRCPEKTLDYHNLLLCCPGRCRGNEFTCDTSKHNNLLKQVFNPADPKRNIENFVSYDGDFSLLWDGKSEPDDDINLHLNLNCKSLKYNREQAWRNFFQLLVRKYKTAKDVRIKKELAHLREIDNPTWTPYVGYISFRLAQLRHDS